MNENDVGRWSFHLIATDRQGQSVGDTLEIVVRQFPSSRLVNHYFELQLSFASRSQAVIKNWEWRVLERLNRFLGGSPGGGLEHMLVRDVGWPDSSGGRRPTLQWTNTTLLHRQCPKEAIQALLRKIAGPNGDATPQLAQAMSSLDIIVRSVRVHYLGSCLATVSRPPPVSRKPGGGDKDDHPVLYDGNNVVIHIVDFIKCTLWNIIFCKISIKGSCDSQSAELSQCDCWRASSVPSA